MARFDLRSESRIFAGELSSLLNGTVCDGIALTAAVDKHSGSVVVAYDPSADRLGDIRGIPVCVKGRPRLYIGLSIRLRPDHSNAFLMVVTSFMSIARDQDVEQTLVHYDYERDKLDGYPDAHMQIRATSEDWEAVVTDRPLHKLHFPVGGRRYRPTLEDLIELLIVERMADPRPGWREVLEKSREVFQFKQLRAAVRNHPDVALEVLRRENKI